VLFHLVTLGLTALLAVIPFSGTEARVFLLRIGMQLILVGTAYAIALRMLTNRKEEAAVSEFDAHVQQLRRESAMQHPNGFEVTRDASADMAPRPGPKPRLGEPHPGP
jgi:hypothetical protein